MDSLSHLTIYIAQYGYYAIFLMVFLQQIGVPNPITNELALIFCGYLSYTRTLAFYKVIAVAIAADCAGSLLVFFIFYSFGEWLVKHSPKWLPVKGEKIEKIKSRVLKHGHRGIFICRMTPFIRGYVLVAAGLLTINRKAFCGTVIFSSVIWNAGLVLIGMLLAPHFFLRAACCSLTICSSRC